ncbi:hypothetical protein H5410_018131 [Solanum commersonii]|uniref:Uncharacterized protein n=1 Tax=Solanum commersonii TaxID=4109 RepID=A0A9J6A1Z0_SOLCO|nr:hypothetical protein H5410_018131 [Solanum commersonii]
MNITILLRHSGIWVSNVNYEGYKVDGIVVEESISFMNLKALIIAELEIDGVRKDIEIRYIVDENTCPLKIRNDMGVKLYLEVRRNEPRIGMYPLCINTTEKMVGEIHNFDCSSGEIICVEGTERDTEPLALVESRMCDLDYIPELNATNYITDSNSTDVKTCQLYKDKETLIVVMVKYKVKNDFNFRVKRSDKKRKKSDVFKVRYFNNKHMCPMRDRILTKVQATVGFIGGVTPPKLFNHKRIHTLQDVIEDIRAIYRVEISYQQTWRAKEHALKMLKGKPLEGYKQMPRYIWMLDNVYPNSYIRMQKTKNNQFMYLFIALRPLIRGFDYCRPIVVVDVVHLGGAYKGTFVSASTLDGAGLKHKNVTDMHPYCSDYYKPDTLEKTYEVAMLDKDDWTVPDYVLDEIVLPPRYKRLVGRPRNRRKKNANEKITVNKNSCGRCGQEGHTTGGLVLSS